MSLAKLQRFIQFLRAGNLMASEDILRTVRHMSVFDRRLGHMGAFRGFIQPEQINTILLEQSRTGDRFGDCAVRLKMMTNDQVGILIKLQKDDLFLFAQAAVTQKLTTTERIISSIKSFLTDDPEAAAEAEPPRSDEKIHLDSQVRNIISGIEKIAPLPATAQRAVAMLEDPEVDLDRVGALLALDPGLTATLLRVVNSAFYGMRDKITSVTKALIVLGIKKLRQLVIAAAVMQKFQAIPPALAQRFWEQSMRVAQWCKEMGEYRHMDEVDEIFVCGLLHNIGHLVIVQNFRPQHHLIEEMTIGGRKLVDAEKSLLGGTHADIGGFMFSLWQMPRETIQSTMFHHHDLQLLTHSPNIEDAVFITHMAATIVDLDPNLDAMGYTEALERISQRYIDPLQLPANINLDDMASRVDASYKQVLSTFTGS